MSRRIVTTLVLSCLLPLGCSKKQEAPAAAAPPPADVQVVTVESHDVPIYGEWVGTTDGLVNAAIKPQVSGYLLRLAYKEGTRVRRGQLLFEIDPRPFQAALAQAEGVLAQAQGQLAQANSTLAQARAILMQAENQLQAAKATRIQADGQLLQAKANLEQAAANQKKTQMDEDRFRPLAEKKAVTQQDLDNAVQQNLVAKAQVSQARATIKTAEGAVASAKAAYGTAESAIASGNAQIGSAMASIRQADAQVQSARAQVEAAQLNLGFTQIVSPIDGIAGVSRAQVGDLLSPSAADPMTTVSTVDPIKVNFTMPEQEYIEDVKRNPSWKSRMARNRDYSFKLIQSDGSEYPRSGRFFSEDRNVAVNTGAILVTAVFPNPGAVLRPGQYSRVRAVRYVSKNALMIPQRAVSEMQDKNQVAVVTPDNKVDIRNVSVGERVGDKWIITDGLKVGDKVVAEGVQKLGPGAPVHPIPYKPNASATPGGSPTPGAEPSAVPTGHGAEPGASATPSNVSASKR